MHIIALCGKKSSGKTTAKGVIESYNNTNKISSSHLSLAAPIKTVASILFNWKEETLYDDNHRHIKEVDDVYWSKLLGYNISRRTAMQKIGDAFLNEFGIEFFCKCAKDKIDNIQKNTPNKVIIIDDLRRLHEYNFLNNNYDLTVIKIERNSEQCLDCHCSETDIDNIPYNHIINNVGTKEEFIDLVFQYIEYHYTSR